MGIEGRIQYFSISSNLPALCNPIATLQTQFPDSVKLRFLKSENRENEVGIRSMLQYSLRLTYPLLAYYDDDEAETKSLEDFV
ncbi:hypothetical protein SFRURICE_019130 [Spodoptera frugiperda]|nr:hypothetical protein SFRURICE_019130 [Spodoptera frugiperda]